MSSQIVSLSVSWLQQINVDFMSSNRSALGVFLFWICSALLFPWNSGTGGHFTKSILLQVFDTFLIRRENSLRMVMVVEQKRSGEPADFREDLSTCDVSVKWLSKSELDLDFRWPSQCRCECFTWDYMADVLDYQNPTTSCHLGHSSWHLERKMQHLACRLSCYILRCVSPFWTIAVRPSLVFSVSSQSSMGTAQQQDAQGTRRMECWQIKLLSLFGLQFQGERTNGRKNTRWCHDYGISAPSEVSWGCEKACTWPNENMSGLFFTELRGILRRFSVQQADAC